MRAVKLNVVITDDHKLSLELPADIPAGPAEVVVLVPEPKSDQSTSSLMDFLEKLEQSDHPRRSKEEIDRYLEEERNSWERDDPRDLP